MNYSRALQNAALIALLLVAALFIVQAYPEIVLSDYSFTVLSGSMEPSIGTGSIVFVSEVSPDSIEEGDVMTYSDDGGNLITHRVVEKKEADTSVRFITKGDANENVDPEPVYRGDVVGVVDFSVPYLGYLVQFSNTFAGWVVLVLLPMLVLFMDGMWQVYLAYEQKHTQ